MDDTLLTVYKGVWIDKTRGAVGFGVWTVGDVHFVLVNLFIGIIFGLVQQSLERLIIHIFAYISYKSNCCPKAQDRAQGNDDPDETTHLNPGSSITPSSGHRRGSSAVSGSRKRNRSCPSCCSRTWPARLLTVIPIVLGVWLSVAGSFATNVSTDEVALSASDTCDLFGLPDGDGNPARQESDALVQGQKEGRAGQYARGCYQSQSKAGLSQCTLFKIQNIAIDQKERQECPFKNQTYCEADGLTAVKFTTPRVKATEIGIMTSKLHTFQRTMICVPLNIEEPPRGPGFVEKTRPQIGYWRYDLGGKSSDEYSSDYTFVQNGDPFETDVRAYTLSTYQHVYSDGPDNYWQPTHHLDIREELVPSSKPYSLTIMFVNSCRIFYKESSDDPIFPAQRTYPNSNLYYNYDSRARPLACIDWIDTFPNDEEKPLPHYRKFDPRLRNPDLPHDRPNPDNRDSVIHRRNDSNARGSSEYNDTDAKFNDDQSYVFMRLALEKSTAFNAIQFRGATGLDAQSRIQDFVSLPLHTDPTQWIVEARGFFETSLARVQYNALDIAIGAGQTDDTYKILTPPKWANDTLCDMFIFQLPKGYHNTNLWVQLLLLFTLIVLGLIGLEMKQDFSEDEKYSPWFDDLKLLWIEWLCGKICCCGARDKSKPPARPDETRPQSSRQSSHGNRRGYNTFDGGNQAQVATSNLAPSQQSSNSAGAAPAGVVAPATSTAAVAQKAASTSNTSQANSSSHAGQDPAAQAIEPRPSTDLADPDNYVLGSDSSASSKAASTHGPRAQAQAGPSSSQAQVPSNTKATTPRSEPAKSTP